MFIINNMKNHKYILILFFFFLIVIINAQENDNIDSENFFNWQFGTIDFFMNINNNITFDFSTNLLYFTFLNEKTKIGIEWDSVRYWYTGVTKEHILTFSGVTIFWNIIKQKWSTFGIFGPFVAVNFLNLYEFKRFSIEKYIFTAGIKYFLNFPKFRLIGFEGGYRNIHGNHSIYIGVQIVNPLVFPLILFQ